MSLIQKLGILINFFRMSYKNKYQCVFYTEKDPLVFKILEIFVRENVIHGFTEEKNYYCIYIRYNHLGQPILTNLNMLYNKPFKLTFTVKQLKSKTFYKKYILNQGENFCFYILSTDQGLMSHKDAINRNVGGTLLFSVKY